MKILGFVPARGGSKAIPKKNTYPLDGRPLIAYTIEEALKSKVNRLIVSTDSPEIAEVSRQHGAEVPFLRPQELAGDHSVIEDAILDALKKLEQNEGYQPDIIVLLHPTTPLRIAKHINESIALLLEKQADAVVSVSEPMEHPGDMVYWDSQGKMRFLLNSDRGGCQRQQYPQCYFINGVVFTFTRKSFLQNKNRFGEKNMPYVIKQIDSIDIDSMDDFLIAEAILMQRRIVALKE
ncbi:cytidylyltransferase domain-containing protein [Candidatus Omnitrophota bacterium]